MKPAGITSEALVFETLNCNVNIEPTRRVLKKKKIIITIEGSVFIIYRK